MIEGEFKYNLTKELKKRFDGCVIFKTDPTIIQGFPDLIILWKNKWAALECKRGARAPHRPNQDYWVNYLNDISFASFIYPENCNEVLDEMEHLFKGEEKLMVNDVFWNDHTRDMPEGTHAFLSPSQHSWCNYSDDKLMQTYINTLASARGTLLHKTACDLIKLKIPLPDEPKTLNMYVNDCLRHHMEPEKKLYYSKFCYGTADAISIRDNKLKIFDLKTGKNKASFVQLRIYVALFFLEYTRYKPGMLDDIELRLYQNNEVFEEHPTTDVIVPIMDTIVRFDRILTDLEAKYDDGFTDSYGRGA